MIDVVMFGFFVVMLFWVGALVWNKWQYRGSTNYWTDLFDEDDRDSIG